MLYRYDTYCLFLMNVRDPFFSDLTVRVRVSVTGIVLSVTDGVVGISGNVGENKSSYNRC